VSVLLLLLLPQLKQKIFLKKLSLDFGTTVADLLIKDILLEFSPKLKFLSLLGSLLFPRSGVFRGDPG
jgi:hypothetical protein